jgi:hypothetical protein
MCGACPRGRWDKAFWKNAICCCVDIWWERDCDNCYNNLFLCNVVDYERVIYACADCVGYKVQRSNSKMIKLLFSLSIFAWVYVCK